MKRIFVLFLALSLLLCACGGTPEVPTTQATEAPTTEAPTTEPTTEATEPPTTEATEPPVLYRNPLNGEPMDEVYMGRPTAVVINNNIHCLPQYGIRQADLMYELETEGDVTRYMAVFSDLSNIGSIGPVRSTRTFFNNIAVSYDAPLIHCGGSDPGLSGHYDSSGDRIDNWNHINEQYNGDYFFRDYDRYYSGYSWEHTLFTNGELLMQALADKEYTEHTETFLEQQGAEYYYGLQFDDEVVLEGEAANSITVKFRRGKTTTMTYNPETGLYEASQYNRPHIDAAVDEVMAYRNVVVLYTSQWGKSDSSYVRSYYELSGEGTGYFACGGQIIPIKWQRDNLRGCFTYTLEDGTYITFGTGATYVGVTSADPCVTYE